jgi:hypothetical protein
MVTTTTTTNEPLKPDEPMEITVDKQRLPANVQSSLLAVPEAATSSSMMLPMTSSREEKQAEESVRENLLALSYAMFDTCMAAVVFNPNPLLNS